MPIQQYASFIAVVVTLAGILAMWLVIRSHLAHAERRTTNRCLHCDYNLQGTPDRCPECGQDVDIDDYIAGPLDPDLLKDEWPHEIQRARVPELSEESIPVHSTTSLLEAEALQEQLSARGMASRIRELRGAPLVHLGGLGGPITYQVEAYLADLQAARAYTRGLRRSLRVKTASPRHAR